MKNQCKGCQAGWPLKKSVLFGCVENPFWLHEVIGGYKVEIVACTRGDYESNELKEEKQ